MPAVPIPRRQHLGVRSVPAVAPIPPPNQLASPANAQAVAAPTRRRPPQVLVPASPELPSNPSSSGDPPIKMYTVRGSDVILKRYRVRGGLGFGSTSTVVRAEDEVTGTAVAIKVLHRNSDLHVDVHHEEHIYEKLLASCNPNVELFAQVLGSGVHHRFHCVIFELCEATLFEVLQGYSGLVPLPMRHIIEIAFQILKAVGHLHSLGIVHTDIKLENIALKKQDAVKVRWLDTTSGFQEKNVLLSSQICVLDLGGAVELQGRGVCHGRIGTRGYRAPEVSLGLPWGLEVDIFSVGCVIAELYLGQRLFDNNIEGDREYLAAVQRLLGAYPREYAEAIEAKYSGTFSLVSGVSVLYPPPGSTLSASDYAAALRRLERMRPLAARIHDAPLHDLLRKLLDPVPAKRIPLDIAAKHEFFDNLSRLHWA